jgi:hypothetical protein
MNSYIRHIVWLSSLLALSACGPVKVVSAPQVQLSQLDYVPSSQTWNAKLLMRNFSNVPMRFVRVRMQMKIADALVASNDETLDFLVPADSGESYPIKLALQKSAADTLQNLAANARVEYILDGSIDTQKPSGHFKFHYVGQLSKTPGLPNQFR